MKKTNSGSKNIFFILGFLLIAVVLIVVCYLMRDTLETSEEPTEPGYISDSEIPVTDTGVKETSGKTEQTDAETEAVVQTIPHISPKKLVCSEAGTEVSDIAVVLNKETNKTHKMDLKDFALNGDTIDSFTFSFHAEDGVSYLGLVKGGYGISVDNVCPIATDDNWYQCPEDFSVSADGSYGEITWKIPDEIKDYITFSTGKLLFGYWWSDVDSIVLDRVVCNKKTVREIPVDGEKTLELHREIKTAEPENKLTIPVSDLISEEDTLQCVTLRFEAADVISSMTGRFGVSTLSVHNGFYNEKNMVCSSGKNTVELTWIIPESLQKNIDRSGNIEFTLNKCSLESISAASVYAQYSNNG
ncbi:MAG: hypothetical protein E7505_04155 [Ruminococcus sp.]|nr:hypothetical protein [Ruminococcus sp.]